MRDVVIIGAGIIGSSIALELARRGIPSLLLEKSIPGAESSSAAAGMLAPQLEGEHADAAFELGLWSRALYADFAGALGGAAVGYHRDGGYLLAASEEELAGLERKHAWQRGRGLRVERVEAQELHRALPGLRDSIAGALYLPDEAQVDPRLLMGALARATEAAGVRHLSGVHVRRVVIEGGKVAGVELADRRLPADVVIVAAGAWSSLVPGSTVPDRAVLPARGQMLALELPAPPFHPFVWAGHGYLVPRRDGRVLVGSTVELAGFDKAVTAAGLSKLLGVAVQTVPALAQARVADVWAGLRPWTEDQAPILGAGQASGLYLATGHSRNGILQAPATARLLAQLLTGETPSLDLAPFALRRFL